MPKRPKWLVWLWLWPPALLIGVYATVTQATGPFFLSPNFDPDYVYLFNGLNIARGQAPLHTDHPGTPLQLLGAAWIRLHNLNATSGEMAVDTIAHSEDRLAQLNLLLFFLLLGAVAAAGLFIRRRSQKDLSIVLPASGILFLGVNIYCLGRFNPEPFLLLNSFLLGLASYWYCSLDQSPNPATNTRFRMNASVIFPLLAAFLIATELATKINSAPLALLPLCLIRGWRGRLAYLLASLAFLALWLIPDYGQITRMAGWWAGLATNTGRYGAGSAGWLDASAYLNNLVELTAANLPYFLLITGSFIMAVHGLIRRRSATTNEDQKKVDHSSVGVLLTVSGVELLQFFIAGKYRYSRYLVPGMGLAGFNLLLLLDSRGFAYAQRWLKPVVIAFAFAGAVVMAGSVVQLSQRTTENIKIYEAGQNSPGHSYRIFGYGASSPYYAWFHPELYHRVLTYSGTYTNNQTPKDPALPNGAWEYHQHLIPQSPAKPLRVWLEAGANDNGSTNTAADLHNWVIANERMANVLKAKGYHYQFVYAEGAGHVDNKVVAQTLPHALEWLWQGFPPAK